MAGFMPKKSGRKKPRITGATQRGPRYEQAAPPPSFKEVQQTLADQRPGSPTEIAAQGLTGQMPCGNPSVQQAIARAKALEARAMALAAELLSLASQSYSAAAACAAPVPNCTQYNKILARLAQINAELPGILAEAQAIQALAATSGSGNCGGGAPMGLPPGMNRAAVFKKFGIRFPGGPSAGSGPSALLPDGAMEQLEELAAMDGMNAGFAFDGRRLMGGLPDKMKKYGAAAARASALEDKVAQSKARMEELKESRKDSPSAEAEYEYNKINYGELGPKYAALAQERHEAALNVASEALSSPAPSMAAVPDPEQKPLLDGVKEALIEEAGSQIEERKNEAIEDTLTSICGEKCAKSLMGVWDINKEAREMVSFDETWTAAIAQLGSASLSSDKVDALAEKLGAGSQKVWDTAQEKVKDVMGNEEDD